jgi:hypothetical protein
MKYVSRMLDDNAIASVAEGALSALPTLKEL